MFTLWYELNLQIRTIHRRARAHIRVCLVCGGPIDTGTPCSANTSVFHRRHKCTSAPYSSSSELLLTGQTSESVLFTSRKSGKI